ncbi:hypothetical protein OO184_08380 [Photorhabdus sp. APURE]|nr:hypothetical protein [Photorhabdus aballayi]MCW7547953.1 hypothetical protein [Photorhabdus aballayi]
MLRTPSPQTFPPETLSLDELIPKNHPVTAQCRCCPIVNKKSSSITTFE